MTPVRRAVLMIGVGGLAVTAGYLTHLGRLGLLGGGPAADIGEALLASRFSGLDGTAQHLAGFRGQVLVVNYWATWCAPCREEIPMFVRLQREYAAKNVKFVGIAVDQVDKVREFSKEFAINYPLLIAGFDAIELTRQAGNKAGVLPYTLVLDRQGRMAASIVGGISEERMRSTLLPLL